MAKTPLDEFMKQQPPKKARTILAPFLDDILTLKKEGYTEAVILEYLTENGVKTSQQNLNRFLRRQMELRAAVPVSQSAAPQSDKEQPRQKTAAASSQDKSADNGGFSV